MSPHGTEAVIGAGRGFGLVCTGKPVARVGSRARGPDSEVSTGDDPAEQAGTLPDCAPSRGRRTLFMTTGRVCVLPAILLAGLLSACGILSDRTRATGLLFSARSELQASHPDRALADAREARDLDPTILASYELAAAALTSQGRDEEAIAELELALQAVRGESGLDRAALLLADTLLRTGKTEWAAEILRTRIAQRGPLRELVYSLAELLMRDGRPEEALAVLAPSVRRLETDPVGAMLEAMALAGAGRLDEAAHQLESDLAEKPDRVAAAIDLFLPLPCLEPLLARLHALRPSDAVVALALGKVRLLGGRAEEASALARAAIESEPGQVEAHYLLARCLLEQGETRASLEAMDRTLGVAPAEIRPRLLGEMASLEAALGEFPEAAERLRQALRLDPANVLLLDNLALLSHQHPEAVSTAELQQFLETALEFAPRDLRGEIEARLTGQGVESP